MARKLCIYVKSKVRDWKMCVDHYDDDACFEWWKLPIYRI